MTEAFKWTLSPTERRIAEMAFASAPRVTARASASARSRAGARWAVCKVLELRGLAGAYMPCTDDECDAMLAELRSEPAPVCNQRVVSTSFVSPREERYRALLEVALRDVADLDDAWLVAVRKELAR